MGQEANLQRRVKAWCKTQNLWAMKIPGSALMLRGIPDMLILVPVEYQRYAIPLFVELKAPSAHLTPLQGKMQQILCAAGAAWALVRSVETLADMVERLREGE